MKLFDSLRNFVTGLGTARDKSTASHYFHTAINRNQAEMMYNSSWAARKAVDLIPDDETREWREWEAEQAETLYKAERELNLRAKVNLARKYERLYGGAAILVGIDAGETTEAVNLAGIQPNSIRYLHVFDRWQLSAVEWDDDIGSPRFGKPTVYQINTGRMAQTIDVHASRLVIFDGLEAPRIYRESNDGFGLSVYDFLNIPIQAADTTTQSTAALTLEATMDVVKVPGLHDYLGDAESQRRLQERFTLAMMMKGTHRTLLLGGDEEYDRKQTSFTGLPELMDSQHEVIAAALAMPLTRFLGRSPGGLNSTGDNELRNYYDMIRSRQQTDLANTIKPLDDALKAHVGASDDGVVYTWAPLWVPTPGEKADIEKKQAEIDTAYVNMGIFSDDLFAKAIRDKLIAEGTYPSLDQHVPETELTFVRPSFDPPPSFGQIPPPEGE